jgi:23S rRNA (cytidine1920-2'-O)/16S rRNA (cytidine1409-2'-O)-methyltransferase
LAKAPKQRLDLALVARGLVPTRARAQALVLAGSVRVNGTRADKAGLLVDEGVDVQVAAAAHPFVSRGGVKLAGALDAFGVDPRGLFCLDVGASTGGFTDCLLQRGALRVAAVDVGTDSSRTSFGWTRASSYSSGRTRGHSRPRQSEGCRT